MLKVKYIILILFIIPFFVLAKEGLPPEAGILPGSKLYFLDKLGERVRELFVFSPEAKIRLQISFSAERVAEINKLLETKEVESEELAIAQARLEDHNFKINEIIEKEVTNNEKIDKDKLFGELNPSLQMTNKTMFMIQELKRERNVVKQQDQVINPQTQTEKKAEKPYKKVAETMSIDNQSTATPTPRITKTPNPIYTIAPTSDHNTGTKIITTPSSLGLKARFSALEDELNSVKNSKTFLSLSHYERIRNDLGGLLKDGYSSGEIDRLDKAAVELTPEIADQIKPTPTPTSIATPLPTTNSQNNDPVLKNLGVRFEAWDRSTNRAGDFIFQASENKVFLEYGAEVQSAQGGTKILPTFEYRTALDADVLAVVDGVVTKAQYQSDTGDYEIIIQPDGSSQWVLGQDHISNLKVSEGSKIKAGDILGKVGPYNNGLGRTEIMLWKTASSRPETHCPLQYFDPQLLTQFKQKIEQHMKDWEEFKGNQSLFNEEKHFLPGCAYEVLLD